MCPWKSSPLSGISLKKVENGHLFGAQAFGRVGIVGLKKGKYLGLIFTIFPTVILISVFR
jgi:hypothetical protein